MEKKKSESKFEVTNEAVTGKFNVITWLRNHQKICISIGVIAIILILGIVIFITVRSDSGEVIFKEYIKATYTGNTDKMMEYTDLKAILAWKNCSHDTSQFKEAYDKVTDEEVNKYKDKYKETLKSSYSSYDSIFGGNMEIDVTKVEKNESLGNGLEKYKGTIKLKMFGIENEAEMTMIIYNGKYVVEVSN